jgi:hypothetical protein
MVKIYLKKLKVNTNKIYINSPSQIFIVVKDK